MSNTSESPAGDELLDELDETTLMLGRLMASRHGQFCDDMPVTGAQLMLMVLLEHGGPTKAGDLAVPLGIKAPATTSLLDALERDGFVTREHGSKDRRVTLVSLTKAGSAVLEDVKKKRREHMRTFLAGLGREDVVTLIRIQRRIIEALVDQPA